MAYCGYNGYYGGYYGGSNCNSSWYNWGRWVLFGGIIVAFILFFFLCSCFTARRRRKAGRQPFYGTGWAVPNKFAGAPAQNYQQPPQYGQQQSYNQGWNNQPAQGGHYGENSGYYGGQSTELQPPQNAYRGGDNVYAPPTGPPPIK